MVTGREERNTEGDRRTREKTDRRRSEDPGVRDQQKEGQKRERQTDHAAERGRGEGEGSQKRLRRTERKTPVGRIQGERDQTAWSRHTAGSQRKQGSMAWVASTDCCLG